MSSNTDPEFSAPEAPSSPAPSLAPVREIGKGLLGHAELVVTGETETDAPSTLVRKSITNFQPTDPAQFRREFEALTRLEHPGLVKLHDLVFDARSFFFTSEYIDGADLLQFLLAPSTAEEQLALDVSVNEGPFAEETSEAAPVSDQRVAQTTPVDSEDPKTLDLVILAEDEALLTGVVEAEADLDRDQAAQILDAFVAEKSSTSAAPPEEEDDPPLPSEEVLVEAEAGEPDEPAEASLQESLPLETAGPATPEGAEAPDPETPAPAMLPAGLCESTGSVTLDLVFFRLEKILPTLIGALEHLHRFRKSHGNLKPSNILIDAHGVCHLTDYGLLAALEPVAPTPQEPQCATEPEEADQPLSKPSRGYQAPEVAAGGLASAAGDLYALGCILFEAIAGKPYVLACTQAGESQRSSASVSLSEVEPRCPASWVELIHGLLNKDGAKRPALGALRRQIETSETRSVNIPPSVIPEQEFFFGRTEILDPLVDIAKRCAQEKRLALAMLEGEPGVGKTAVVDALAYWASQQGWLVLRGRCYDRESVVYQGWDDVIIQLAQICDKLPEKLRQGVAALRRRAAPLFPWLPEESGAPGNNAAMTRTTRLDAIDGLHALFAKISAQRPILFCFDDIHWASSDTSALLLDFFAAPEGLRCMCVVTSRQDMPAFDDKHLLLRGLRTAPVEMQRISIPGFSKSEAREYVLAMASSLPLQQKQTILKRGEFHPLLIEELIHDLTHSKPESSSPRRQAVSKQVVDAAASGDDQRSQTVTERLRTLLDQRIAALTRSERLVLQLLAVASGPLAADLLSRVVVAELGAANLPQQPGAAIADKLCGQRLVRRVSDPAPDDASVGRYIVVNDICRQVVLNDLGREHHAHLCNLIARAITRTTHLDAEDLRFEYLQRAGNTQDATQSAIRAAQIAEQRFAFHRAAKLWRWLLEHPIEDPGAPYERMDHTTPPSPYQFDVQARDHTFHLASLARVEHLAGRYEEAARLYASQSQGCDDQERAQIRLHEAMAWLKAGDAAQAILAVDEALRGIGERYAGPQVGRTVEVLVDRALTAPSRWSDVSAIGQAGAATQTDQLQGDIYRFIIEAASYLDLSRLDHFRSRFSRLASQTGDACLLALDRVFLAEEYHFPAIQGHKERTQRRLEQSLALLEGLGAPEGLAAHSLAWATVQHRSGDFDEALAALEKATAHLGKARETDHLQSYRVIWSQAMLALDCGDLALAETLARRILHVHRGNHRAASRAHQILTQLYLLRGDLDNVERHINLANHCFVAHESSFINIWFAGATASWNIAMGRPEVAVGQLDAIQDNLHQLGLHRLAAVDVLLTLRTGQALAALAERERLLNEPRQAETARRLRSVVRRLEGLRPQMSPQTQSEISRLRARHEVLNHRLPKALREATRATAAVKSISAPLCQARCAEVQNLILLRLEKSEARQGIEEARATYTKLGCHLPLVLEGWPVPKAFSWLRDDDK